MITLMRFYLKRLIISSRRPVPFTFRLVETTLEQLQKQRFARPRHWTALGISSFPLLGGLPGYLKREHGRCNTSEPRQENLTPHENTCVPTPSSAVFRGVALGPGQGSPAEPAALPASLNFWWPFIATHGSSNSLRLHQTMSLTLGTTKHLEATCRGSTRQPMAELGL
jgi:hypothetical protein